MKRLMLALALVLGLGSARADMLEFAVTSVTAPIYPETQVLGYHNLGQLGELDEYVVVGALWVSVYRMPSVGGAQLAATVESNVSDNGTWTSQLRPEYWLSYPWDGEPVMVQVSVTGEVFDDELEAWIPFAYDQFTYRVFRR